MFFAVNLWNSNYEENMHSMSNSPKRYYTISARERTEIKIKGSRFIASTAPVTSKEQALTVVDDLRKEFYDASHNCFAYRIGGDGLQYRFADDGEPNGSAGKPMLFVLQKFEMSDVVVVVTRYFGGTRLGIGGLARAYSDATEQVLMMCKKVEVWQTQTLRVMCTYQDVDLVKRLVQQFAINYTEQFHDAVEFIARVPIDSVEECIRMIGTQTHSRAGVLLMEEHEAD